MTRAIHWFRNDLRLRDNTALRDAAQADQVALLYVLDDRLLSRSGTRARHLVETLERLDADLPDPHRLIVRRGRPEEVVPAVLREARATQLCFNRDTTPFATARDERVRRAAEKLDVEVIARRDRVVFEADQVTKDDGSPYVVYTPYAKRWYRRIADEPMRPERAPRLPDPIPQLSSEKLPDPASLDPEGAAELPTAGSAAARRRLQSFLESDVGDYDELRDRPDRDGTSRLSPYLRFGAISIRECVYEARDAAAAESRLGKGARKWIDELVWRDFYAAILETHPRVARQSFREEYDRVRWRNDEKAFEAWCTGRTGYPIVDAGMRQLVATGWMHNRVRMIAASFLTKDLLTDWRWGERFWFEHLVDGDPASNNGGWQWAASTGTDPQPYFRIFNPTSQGTRWDPDGEYVRRWIPELRELRGADAHEPWKAPALAPDYPPPVVDHGEARTRALAAFERARGKS